MDVLKAIQGRRSVRSYVPGKLDSEVIHTLLAAAVQAPTAIHEEPWGFVVLQDLKVLKRISDRAKGFFVDQARQRHRDQQAQLSHAERTDFNIFHNAGNLIVIYGKTENRSVVADCWLAAENLMLAAYSLGLGTCVIGSAVSALNDPDTRAELDISPEFTAFSPIIVGISSGDVELVSRKEPQVLFWK